MGESALYHAQEEAFNFLSRVEEKGLLRSGVTEKTINTELFALAKHEFGIDRFWHKRIIRSGPNTLCPYDDNPPDRIIESDDILFLDLGPIFEDWEADIGKTYVLGEDPIRNKLLNDTRSSWQKLARRMRENPNMLACDVYHSAVQMASDCGWEFGGEIAGHLVGKFPHNRLENEDKSLYIHPENSNPLSKVIQTNKEHLWILEMHFVDRNLKIGSFFEELV